MYELHITAVDVKTRIPTPKEKKAVEKLDFRKKIL